VTSPFRTLRAFAWALCTVLVAAPCVLAAPTAAAAVPTPTSVTFSVVPDTTPIDDRTSVVVEADVTPAAPGIVRVSDGGFPILEIAVVGGHASKRTILPIGDLNLVATFVPDSPALYAPSHSASESVPVLLRPYIWLESLAGARVADGGKVFVGSTLRVVLDRMPPGFVIGLQLTGTATQLTITCDEQGTGRGQIIIPYSLRSAVYRLEGPVGVQTVVFTFYVYNPKDATPTPTPTPVSPTPTPTPTPIATTPAQVAAGTPASTPAPALAHTGWDDSAVLLYGVAFTGLGFLVVANARPRRLGRHSRD
jgi:hypothetical protein